MEFDYRDAIRIRPFRVNDHLVALQNMQMHQAAHNKVVAFAHHFYQPQPLRTPDAIRAGEKEAEALLDELRKGKP